MKYTILTTILLFSPLLSFSQSADELLFENARLATTGQTSGETAINVAKKFIGKPYVAATLEKTPEQLVCNLREFDCYTLVENVVAIARMKNEQLDGFDNFQDLLISMRYRNGKLDGYASRMHYFTEWIVQAEKDGFITDMTKIWGKPSGKQLTFMSQHPQYYAAMKDKATFSLISAMENEVNKTPFYEIKKADFMKVEKHIRNGDIIVFTSTVGGLDVNHEGFAYWQNGQLHLLHASLDYKRVMISPEPLGDYLKSIPKHQGIIVLRLK